MISKYYFNEKSIQILDKVLEQQNDTYFKYKSNCLVETIIIESLINKPKLNNLKVESYSDYLKMNIQLEDKQWIYNIIDHTSESENILYENNNLIIIPDYKWTGSKETLHILCIFKDKSLFSIRDLTSNHIPLLEEAINYGNKIIKEKYDINKENLIMYFHYHPSVWQLHLHYMILNNDNTSSYSLPRAHSINSVIQNLKIDSDYYKKVELEIKN
jgi:m7GpppX diphosphatase